MKALVTHALFVCALIGISAGCGRSGAPLSVTLVPAAGATPAFVKVTGLSSDEISSLGSARLDEAAWQVVFSVHVADAVGAALPVVGRYRIDGDTIAFVPKFAFDAGRRYEVTFDPARLPRARQAPVVHAVVALPGVARAPSTTVIRVLPSSEIIPENVLRMYVEFSAPMSRNSGLDYITLRDDRGRVVPEAFLPLDVDFWNPEQTRYTVFFDPGRVKRGIMPNEQLGRAVRAGRTYTIEIDARWPDAHGQPLRTSYRQSYRVGPAEDRPIEVSKWKLTTPAAGRRDPLIVSFPSPLDHGLLQRAIGVSRREGGPIAGTIRVDAGERTWNFVPDEPWQLGAYRLVVLSILEDVAGNRIGRAFEVDRFERVDPLGQPEQVTIAFEVGAVSKGQILK